MIIYPAIDLRNGQCVRLYQGDYQRETVYNTDPFSVANDFVNQGAEWLHIVDLDGARNPKKSQEALIGKLIRTCKAKIQMGGGIRDRDQIKNLFDQGVTRIIVGSLAIKDPNEVLEWFRLFGAERILLALDINYNENKQPIIAIDAWQSSTCRTPFELIEYYQSAGLINILCTDIMCDGTLNGPNYLLYDSLLTQFPFLKIQASGGIQSLSDLQLLRKNGLAGAITGRALYENKFTLREALSC